MLKAVLIDDERKALEVLELQLAENCKGVTILAACEGGEKGIEAIKKFTPDVVFLDIDMPHKNGFDVLSETKDFEYDVIFTTAYDQFALKAFKFSTIDYLLKPVDVSELQQAVTKAMKRKGSAGSIDKKLEILLNQFGQNAAVKDKVALPVGDTMQFFKPDEIIRCESDSNYTNVHLINNKKVLLTKTLKEVEETLIGLTFIRIHQSHLVNMDHITSFSKSENGYVVMSDGTTHGISRNRKEDFLDKFRKL